jgi:hypothetical protein
MSQQEFETVVESGERGRVFITFPFDPVKIWGKKQRHYVKGTLNGKDFSGSLGVRDGKHFMPLNKELQKSAGLKPGDAVKVIVNAAEAERADIPDDLAQALQVELEAQRFFASLTNFYAGQYVEWITSAKQAETRTKRIQETIGLLKSGKRQR